MSDKDVGTMLASVAPVTPRFPASTRVASLVVEEPNEDGWHKVTVWVKPATPLGREKQDG